jgi:hypothetical protein
MSILNVNTIQPVGSGQTITVSAANISASSTVVTASSFVGNVTGTVNSTGVITATSFSGSGANLTGIAATTNVRTDSLVVSGITTVAAGSTSAPSISPTGDSNTGIFFPSADTIAFAEGGAEAARFNSSGELLVGTTSSTVNGGKLQISNGITFPATAVACTNANTLDDYEEGTWTPVVSFGGASVGITGTFTGTYTKIGNSINVYFRILFTSKGSSTGTMKVAGLPFASALNYKANSGFAYVHRLAALQTSGQMYAADVGSELYFWFVGYGGAFASVFSNATVSNDSQINGSIIYF